jgi:CheY-like chemotaxis protein
MMNHLYLIAEDEADTQVLIRRAFMKAGLDCPVEFVSDGEEAIDYLKGRGKFSDRTRYPIPAIMLLDFNMPKQNGLEVLTKIRRDDQLKKLVVLMLSSSVDEREILAAYELGVNSYVEKPSSFHELVHTVLCINQYWFGCAHFPHSASGIVRPHKRHRQPAR